MSSRWITAMTLIQIVTILYMDTFIHLLSSEWKERWTRWRLNDGLNLPSEQTHVVHVSSCVHFHTRLQGGQINAVKVHLIWISVKVCLWRTYCGHWWWWLTESGNVYWGLVSHLNIEVSGSAARNDSIWHLGESGRSTDSSIHILLSFSNDYKVYWFI